MILSIVPVVYPTAINGLNNGLIDQDCLHEIDGGVGKLLAPAHRAWNAMKAAALADGIVLQPTSSADCYRSYDVQVRTFEARYTTQPLPGRPTRTWDGVTYWQQPGTAAAAVPGTSNHGWGLAVDVANASGDLLDWLAENCRRYGWSHELQSEPWHVRYVDGDRIPQAVLDFERPAPEEDWMTTNGDYIVDELTKLNERLLHWFGLTSEGWVNIDTVRAGEANARHNELLAELRAIKDKLG